jgi:hypothetical protein
MIKNKIGNKQQLASYNKVASRYKLETHHATLLFISARRPADNFTKQQQEAN